MNFLADPHLSGHARPNPHPLDHKRMRPRAALPPALAQHMKAKREMPHLERLGAQRSFLDKIKSARRHHVITGATALAFAGLSGFVESGDLSVPIGVAVGVASFAVMSAVIFVHRKLKAEERIRKEKDALIAELEQARAHSDEARRRAEDLNLAKSRFLATMSHELRTPLNAILGFSEVMEAEILGEHHVPAYRDYAHDIHKSGKHLLDLINEILDLSRIEAGRYDLQEAEMRLDATVAECAHLIDRRAQQKSLAMLLMIEPSMPMIKADERAVRQIALNLLSNAIKFTPEGGEVVIRTGVTEDGRPYLQVNDTGPGIPAHEIPIIMENFGRGSLAVKLAEQGTGLGLPIVRGLVAMHGGEFKIESREDEGTSVTVTFPPERVCGMPLTALAAYMQAREKKAAA
jgi:two-component system cell cycle sensor histidine kinase PleC